MLLNEAVKLRLRELNDEMVAAKVPWYVAQVQMRAASNPHIEDKYRERLTLSLTWCCKGPRNPKRLKMLAEWQEAAERLFSAEADWPWWLQVVCEHRNMTEAGLKAELGRRR